MKSREKVVSTTRLKTTYFYIFLSLFCLFLNTLVDSSEWIRYPFEVIDRVRFISI